MDDIARTAGTSHGTFYLYFSSIDDLLGALIHEALRDMDTVISAFPAVGRTRSARAALRSWVRRFCDVYAHHAVALRMLSQADAVGPELQRAGLRLLWRVGTAISTGMIPDPAAPAADSHSEFTALACALMLERMNYLLSVQVPLPREELAERMTDIIAAAFAS